MTSTPVIPRSTRLREWMDAHQITDEALGEKLGLHRVSVCRVLNAETMRTVHHAACLELGFPPELLPIPYDKPRGPRPKQPVFPGLVGTPLEA